MKIDPQGWFVTLPLLVALVWLYFQPAEHVVKQAWRDLLRHEAHAMGQLAGVEVQADTPGRLKVERLLFWAVTTILSVASAASLAVYLGVVPG